MAKISKYVKLDKDILLEYIYDDNNVLSEPYQVLVDSRDRSQSFVSGESSVTGNTQGNQLFKVDNVTQKYGKINTSYYSFLQLKDYASGAPLRYDTIKVHIPINWTFGEYLGFYIRVYAFDTSNMKVFNLSNFYFDMTDVSQQYLLNFSSPPLLFQEKLWGKNISIDIPALSAVSAQKANNVPKVDSINANLTGGVGFSMTSPIFLDFQFITNIQTINGVTTYLLNSKTTTTIPQTPEFEKLGLVVRHSPNGDFFEIYGTYNDTIGGFTQFIDESYNIGHRYYVQYNITMYEQNIRGKTTTVTVHENFNETIEYRPIIKYSTTTAIIDVEMRLIDAVDDSYIIRRASYGMLQDEVAKYSLNLIKIKLDDANKPKIYNIKNSIDPSLVGLSNSMGMIKQKPRNLTGRLTNTQGNNTVIKVEKVEVPFPVLVDKFNIIGKSENVTINSETFYANNKIQIVLYPFDNIVRFVIASGDPLKPDYLNMNSYGEIKLVFRNDSKVVEFPTYKDAGGDPSIGQISFKVSQSKYGEVKTIYNTGVNVFYITSTVNSLTSVVYSGLYKIHENISNIASMNAAANANPQILIDPNLKNPTVVAVKKPLTKMPKPIAKPGLISEVVKQQVSKANQMVSSQAVDTEKTLSPAEKIKKKLNDQK